MQCLTTTGFSSLGNEVSGEPFRPERGIWHGHPISRYIFIISTEYLGRYIHVLTLRFQGRPKNPQLNVY